MPAIIAESNNEEFSVSDQRTEDAMPKTPHQLKQIPYGEADYRKIRFGNYLYVDKTRYIESLENCGSNYPFIVRPRRFGKSLFTDTLQLYDDKAHAANFDANFSGTYIGSHKTALAGQFYVLKFVFAGLTSGDVARNFYDCVLSSLNDFFTTYPHPRQNEILQGHFDGAAALIERFFAVLGEDFQRKLYVIIDEYDQFANAVLANSVDKFREITSTDGFLKDFYTKLKTATSGNGVIARIFITGVTYISLDSMTSGFSIATNLTTDPEFAGLFGFSEEELRTAIPQVVDLETYGETLDAVVERMKEWYNGYHFSTDTDVSVFNASMCFHYLRSLQRRNKEPSTLLDPAFAQDLEKISGILSLGHPAYVRRLVTEALQHETIDFPAGNLQLLNLNERHELDGNGVLSAMVYMGYLTFVPDDDYSLTVPNRAVAIQFFEYFLRYICSAPSYLFTGRDLTAAYQALFGGNPEPLFRFVSGRFADESGTHVGLHLRESDFQTLIEASLYFTDAFVVEREVEARGSEPGFIDLLIRPKDAGGFAYLVELKYLTKKAGSDAAVQEALHQAQVQAAGYAQCSNIREIPNLKRVAAVFVGTELKALTVEG